ncbi:MAG: peptidoglycan D,D-transpeptidase FtsI family protein [Coriobacteriales bacterium]
MAGRGDFARGRSQAPDGGFNRELVILGFFAAVILIIFIGLLKLCVFDAPQLAARAEDQAVKTTVDVAKRGTIYDRNGEVIASSIESTTINLNPNDIDYTAAVSDAERAQLEEPQAAVAKILFEQLGATYDKKYEDYYEMVTRQGTAYVVVQRRCDKELAAQLRQALKDARLQGVYYEEDSTRVYPNGQTGSQVIGTVGLKMLDQDGNIVPDDQIAGRTDLSEAYRGTSGLELQYDTLLAGVNGSIQQEKSDTGIPIAGGSLVVNSAQDGEDMICSLDIKLQQKAEKSLKSAIAKYKAQGGSVTIMDAATGELYAAASFTKTTEKKKTAYTYDAGKLWSVADSYEPGSTFKTFTAYSVVDAGKADNSTVFSVPAKLKVYDHTVTDSHERSGTERMSLQTIIADSSNIGTVLASRKVSLDKLYKTYKKFGFGEQTGVDFPGAASGMLEETQDWDGVQAANITFGQGVAVTGMQMVRAYGAIEQGGTMRVPHFLVSLPNNAEKSAEYAEKLGATKKAANKKTCDKVTKMLRSVVTSGTGKAAAIKGLKVVGKTGTAEVAGSTGSYIAGAYIVSFCGWIDESDCDLVCLVTIERPKTDEGGGPVCGPVFADIMSFAANRYQVGSTED